jgi:hypothetical protein
MCTHIYFKVPGFLEFRSVKKRLQTCTVSILPGDPIGQALSAIPTFQRRKVRHRGVKTYCSQSLVEPSRNHSQSFA